MSEITCNVITDLLELYADEIVSNDTRQIVEEHLTGCDKCNEKLIKIKQKINIPAEINIKPLNRIKRGIKKKNIIISVVSVLIVSAILLGLYYFITNHETVIPYNKTHIYNIEIEDYQILIHFIDNIDSYKIQNKYIDDKTMEVYICFNATYQTRYLSKRQFTNQFVSAPRIEGYRNIEDGIIVEEHEYETVKIYYCNMFRNGTFYGEKTLIWEK